MADKRSVIDKVETVIDNVLGKIARFPAMEPTEYLKQQHRLVDTLFARIASERGAQKRRLFDELLVALAIHAELEEQLLYPMMKRAKPDLILEAAEEHLVVKRLLADLIDLDAADPIFDAKITVLRETVHHHVREEELQLMPLARRILDAESKEALLEGMLALELELREGGDLEQAVVDGTDAAAPV